MTIELALAAVRELPADVRRTLAETILDELGESDDSEPLTAEEMDFIDRRMAAYRSNPDRTLPFEEVCDRIHAKYAK